MTGPTNPSNPFDQGVPPEWSQEAGYPPGQPAYGQPPAPAGYGQPAPYGLGPIGETRSTGLSMLWFFLTCGIYGWYWYFKVHEEMKNHTGQGLGGGLGLVLYVLVGIASPFIVCDEVGKLYSRRGQQPPVSGATGLWVFPGLFILVGPFIWFVKTNNALNEYWVSQGAPRP